MALCASSHADVLLSDDFSDGNRTTPAWYYAYGAAAPESATVDTNGTQQNLRLMETLNNNGQFWTTFPSTTLQVGQSLTVFLHFDVSGGIGTSGDHALRTGLFEVAAPVVADLPNTIADPLWADAKGYAAFVRAGHNGNGGPDSTFRQRTGTNNVLWAAAAHAVVVPTSFQGVQAITLGSATDLSIDAPRYSLEYKMTRSGPDAMAFTLKLSDANGVIQEMAGSQEAAIHASFNTFSFFTGTLAAKSFVMDDFALTLAGGGVVITSFERGAGSFTLNWNANGLPVAVERSITLLENSWEPLSSDNVDGMFTDSEPPAGRAFYRVRLVTGPPASP